MIDQEGSLERLRDRRKHARVRLLLSGLALVFALGVLGWRAIRLEDRLSRPSVVEVRVWVDPTGQAIFDGRTYDRDGVDRLLEDIVSAHPGVPVHATVCAPDVSDLTAATISFRSVGTGVTAGVVTQDHALCHP